MTSADVAGSEPSDSLTARREAEAAPATPAPAVLDQYHHAYPSAANAVAIFAGQWSSLLPPSCGVDTGGFINLFEDVRIDWLVDTIGGVAGQRILELGPLEGGHTWSLEARHDAGEIVAIEANQRAYLRCLVAKEILRTSRSRFLLGDFNRFLAESGERFDLVVASGVLYHMEEPARHIKLLCSVADTVFVWTHHYDRERIEAIPKVAARFASSAEVVFDGFSHTIHRQDYLESLGWDGFCGAGHTSANWLELADIEALFDRYGFAITDTAFEEPDHVHGPSLAFVARRR
jgi:hypothetical protein